MSKNKRKSQTAVATKKKIPGSETKETRQHGRRASCQDKRVIRSPRPVLRFSPTAWAKLVFFRDHGDTEIGGFGITPAKNLLYIEDFITVKQKASVVSISFNDEAVADFFETQVDAGKKPEQFARIWLHTHPGESPHPSGIDEETFQRAFGSCDWAVMFILGQGGKTYARMRFGVGPGGETMIPVEVDYSRPFGSSDQESWKTEYKANISQEVLPQGWLYGDSSVGFPDLERCGKTLPEHLKEELEAMDPHERRFILNELACTQDPWEDDFKEEEPWD